MYPHMKFHNHSKCSFGDKHQTEFKYDKKKKGQQLKNLANRVQIHVHCTPPIQPWNFITIASMILEICSGQNSSLKIYKGQKLKN